MMQDKNKDNGYNDFVVLWNLNCNDCSNKDKECYHCIHNVKEVKNYFTPILHTYFCDVCGMRWDTEKKDVKICPNCKSDKVIEEK